MGWFKRLWVRSVQVAREEIEETQDEIVHGSPVFRLVMALLALYVLGAIVIGIYWSSKPDLLDARVAIQRELAAEHYPPSSALPKGLATTATLIQLAQTLLNKPGGYLSNDMMPPGVWLDDMPHWEFGVLLQVRDTTEILRVSLSQLNDGQAIDDDLQKAVVRFNFSNTSWSFPAAESQYLAGIEHLKKYHFRLLQADSADAHFYADVQHLSDYLAAVERRLKNLSQRLSASVAPAINTDMAALPVELKKSNTTSNGLYKKTPWLQVDDIFYEARGTSWALIALLQAIEIDFSDVLVYKNNQASFDQIIRELRPTQEAIYSPMILNGEGFGVVANHSLTMSSYLARAQAAVADCRRQLLTTPL